MKIVVSSQGEDLDALVSPVFGQCATYVLVNTETLEFQALPNPAMNQVGGAGIRAAQFVVDQGAEAVITGNPGPNALGVLQDAGVLGCLVRAGTVREAVEAFKAGKLQPMGGANVPAHAPTSGGRRTGVGRGVHTAAPDQTGPQADRESQLATLRETLKSLRQQLAETIETFP